MSLSDEAKNLPYGQHSVVMGLKRDDEWRKLRVYEPTCADGRQAVLWVMRMPALCWRVTAGDIEMTTGSGNEIGDLADRIARAIAGGMLGFSK